MDVLDEKDDDDGDRKAVASWLQMEEIARASAREVKVMAR